MCVWVRGCTYCPAFRACFKASLSHTLSASAGMSPPRPRCFKACSSSEAHMHGYALKACGSSAPHMHALSAYASDLTCLSAYGSDLTCLAGMCLALCGLCWYVACALWAGCLRGLSLTSLPRLLVSHMPCIRHIFEAYATN